MSLIVRPITADELPRLTACVGDVFGTDPASDPQVLDRVRALLPLARTFAAFDGAAVVGTASAYSFALTVPGAVTVPMGGLTIVTVRPTHRRQGVLRRLMDAHLADVRSRGEALSGLYASEGTIYGRFGYGIAAESDELVIAGGDGLFPAPAGYALVGLDDDDALATLPTIYAEATATRPGMYARSHDWWRWRRIADRPYARRGRSPRRHVVVRKDGVNRGYVVYRQQLAFDDGRAAGTVDVEELIALDPDAEAALLHHVATLDLFPRVTLANAAVDAAAPWLATDYRRVVRRRRSDTLWLRVDDVAAALAGRRYGADGALTLAIHDDTTGAADRRWRLTVDGGVATCVPALTAADLTLPRPALGSLYLGGVTATTLARAGRLAGTPAAVALADRMFASPVAPWCPEQF